MKNILRKILLLFVFGILSQPCVENTCFASKPIKDLNAISKLSKKDIWDIIVEIAKSDKQPELGTNIGKLIEGNATLLNQCESFKDVTFAEFVKNLSGDTLVDAFTTKTFYSLDSDWNEKEWKYVEINKNIEEKINDTLKQIASNPAGKLLIVRLLIQIDIREKESLPVISKQITFLNQNKENDSFCFRNCSYGEYDELYIICAFDDLKSAGDVVLTNVNSANYEFKSIAPGIPEDVALFHEMLHMYHYLNDMDKHNRYRMSLNEDELMAPNDNPVFKYYFENIKEINDEVIVWKIEMLKEEPKYTINCEELLTICGLSPDVKGYEPGDELSENLYRFFREEKSFRFGHTVMNFNCSRKTINKLVDSLQKILNKFGTGYTIKIEDLVCSNCEAFAENDFFLKKNSGDYGNIKNSLETLLIVK